MNDQQKTPQDTKKVFKECGMCSHTLYFILNRAFGQNKDAEEKASDPLAGGLMNTGHQCGMLWGSALASGAESFRRNNDTDTAITSAITATQTVMESFKKRTTTFNCREVTGYNIASIFGMIRMGLEILVKGMDKSTCFVLAENWAPEAIRASEKGLSEKQNDLKQKPVSCASETVKRMGATDEEMVTVAGLAGGMGFSGNACGALAAAIWMKMLKWCREHPGKTPPYFNNPDTKRILKTFYKSTNSEILCHKICGKHFSSQDEHTEFIKEGGCMQLINILAQA
jgi:hypothetical protein